MPMLSLVIPLFNEEALVDELLTRTMRVLTDLSVEFEIIFVDDGSQDETLNKLLEYREKEKRIKVISLSKNFGHQAALTAGMEFASGDYIGMMDGDLQDPPELLKDMYAMLKSDDFEIINGKRIGRKENLSRRMLLSMFHKVYKKVSGLKDIENIGNFSLMNRNALNGLLSMKEKIRYLPGLRSYIGYKQGEFEYIREDRVGSKTKMSIWQLWSLAADAIFSFSKIPLRICILLGTIGVTVFLFAGIYVLIAKIFGFALLGWSSTMLSIYFLGSIQLIFLGILGEYIFRIYKESQNRPLYLVKQYYTD
ncbi:MAG: glycosyltransferase family 2 protein [Bacteroidales bacterium]|nr:glycosyltransferase family 2 protein [Bacteroidales bacterium]